MFKQKKHLYHHQKEKVFIDEKKIETPSCITWFTALKKKKK